MYSRAASQIKESATISIATNAKLLKKQGRDIIDFSLGEPDFSTPEPIKQAAIDAIRDNHSHYTDVAGIAELREAIASKLRRENALDYGASEIIVSAGAKHSIFNALCALLNPGDEVLLPAPYWTSYPEMISFCSASVRVISCPNFKLNPALLESALKSSNPKLLILNSPSNPTGVMYSKDELHALYEVIKPTNMLVLSDEIYEKLVYDSKSAFSFGALSDDALSRTITINGLSKSSAMTGWRMGYVAAKDRELLKLIKNLQSQSTSNINSITQYASLRALDGSVDDDIKKMRAAFEARRNLGVQILKSDKILEENLELIIPDGAFYFYFKLKKHGDAMKFCSDLLEREGVVCVPGEAFGSRGYFRVSFACAEEVLRQGLSRISRFLRG